MKRNYFTSILSIAFFLNCGSFSIAQTDEGFSYQAVLRDNNGDPIQNQTVSLNVSIREQSANGNEVYQEDFTVTTSDIGLVSVVIGEGSVLSGDFSTIDWSSGPHFVTTNTIVNGGSPIAGSTRLLSVPYAKFAAVSGSTQGSSGWALDGNNIDDTTDFLGSTNDADVSIQRNGVEVARFDGQNVRLGENAMVNATGAQNVALGNNNLANTSGQFNVAIGDNALVQNTSGDHNIGMGFVALNQNTSGNENIALGNNALPNNTTGSRNIALGAVALFANTTGERNVAIGGDALNSNTTGFDNVAMGQSALRLNTTGEHNVALGFGTLENNTTASRAIAIGLNALNSNTVGGENIAVGLSALRLMNDGFVNVALGVRALENNTSGNENIAIGLEAMSSAQTTRQIGIGVNALRNATAASFDNIAIGNEALLNNTDGGSNLAIGLRSLFTNITGTNNVAVGNASLESNTGDGNVGLGVGTLSTNIDGNNNTAVGLSALRLSTSASFNTALGSGAMENTTTGFLNVALGSGSMINSNGLGNIAVGPSTLSGVQSQQNIAIGFSTMLSLNGSAGPANSGRNISIGSFGMDALTEGVRNASVGSAGYGSMTTGNRNTGIGNFHGINLLTGEDNTFIGSSAGINVQNGDNNIFIGAGSIVGTDETVLQDVSDQLNIGNSIYGDLSTNQFGFGVMTPTERIDATGGNIKADNFISTTTTYPDYVFETYFTGKSDLSSDYEFQDLKTVEEFVKKNNHLPNIKSHKEVSENGMNVNISELVVKSLEKIEELYLHTIAQQKEIEKLKKELNDLKK